MQKKLENRELSLVIDSYGAELQSILHQDVEYLWQGDSEFWGRRAPVLFPVVGKLKNGQYQAENAVYKMGGHGFARDSEFELIAEKKEQLTYELKWNEETLLQYPYRFVLQITYKLIDNKIQISYSVENQGEPELYFSIGAHPAFNVPLETGKFEDYKLLISPREKRQKVPLDATTGLISANGIKDEKKIYEIPLTHELFKEDALIFKSSPVTKVSLVSKKNDRSVTVSWEGMPYFGLWSPYPKEAPFVCIEPWSGLADDKNTDGNILNKYAIQKLSSRETYSCQYEIEIN